MIEATQKVERRAEGALPPVPPGGRAWRQLRRNRAVLSSIAVLTVVVLAAIFGPLFFPDNYGDVSALQFAPPSLAHPFGTDLLGRDVFYRVLTGARISLVVGLAGALVSLFIGTGYGMIAGYAGGKVDSGMMRLVDILYSIPRLILILIFINAFDKHLKDWLHGAEMAWAIDYSRIFILIVSLGVIEWLTMARIVRGQVLALKSQQFVAAARSLGQSHFKIILRHLLPNILGVIMVYLTLTIPSVILDESFLSFLGLGIQPPLASWGSLIADGAQVINPVSSKWWLLVFPGAVMSLTLLAMNFIGDGLRDAFDPRRKQ